MENGKLVVARMEDRVGMAILNRPSARNALCEALVEELTQVLDAFDADPAIGAILITGAGRDFAAGADLKEMLGMTADEVLAADFSGCCVRLGTVGKPVVAAVDGHALGGGCELVEMCDVVIAADTACFGHPEFTVGTMPGAGGTQRLAKTLGKHAAMDVLLTGRRLTAAEACRFGLVSRVVPAPDLQKEAMEVAARIAAGSAPVARMIKQAVRHSLADADATGLALERSLFHRTFSLGDRREGMRAFVEKRRPVFRHC